MKRSLGATLLSALLVAAMAFATAAPGPPAAQAQGTHLSPTAAKRMMRTVLRREFGLAWTRSHDHRLDCTTAVHPERGGAAQAHEVRRRCFFSWSYERTRYHGRGLVWLSGRNAEGERHWVFQMTVYERHGDQLETFRQSGSVRSP